MTDIKQLSETTKAFMYLGGILVAVAVGGFATASYVRDYSELPKRITQLEEKILTLQSENTSLALRVQDIESMDFSRHVKFGDKIGLQSYGIKTSFLAVLETGISSSSERYDVGLIEELSDSGGTNFTFGKWLLVEGDHQ